MTLNLKTAPGYQVLAAAGKTVLRPGGRVATEQLFAWANFQPGETVLELASGLGISAIALAKRYGVQVVGIEQDSGRVAIAQEKVKAAGVADQVEIIQGNIFHLQALTKKFDYVLAEAILTMQSSLGKAQILAGVGDRLKPGGKFLSHELLIDSASEQVLQELSQAMRVKAAPLSESGWIDTFAQSGLTVQHHQIGAMSLLAPAQVVEDEGIVNAAKLLWNVLTKPALRDRILTMRQVFARHKQNLGYITFGAELAK